MDLNEMNLDSVVLMNFVLIGKKVNIWKTFTFIILNIILSATTSNVVIGNKIYESVFSPDLCVCRVRIKETCIYKT